MKLCHWFSATALAVLLVGAGPALAAEKAAPKEVNLFGTLRTAEPATAKADALAWLQKVNKTDDATTKAFEALWADPERSVLDKVTATFLLGDDNARKLMAEARNPDAPAPTAVPDAFKAKDDSKEGAFYRANLALAYARALANRRVYEEALDTLKTTKPESVVDPGTFLFFKAVTEHAMMKPREAEDSIVRLLDDVPDAPERYKLVAALMHFDMLTWRQKDLGDIARKMNNIERRLDLDRGGPETQRQQKEVVLQLDELIKKLENQKSGGSWSSGGWPSGGQKPGSSSGKNPNNNTRASSPQDDSYGGTGSGPGNVDPKKLKEIAEVWGKLPEKERAQAVADMTRDMPPRYREVIEKYLRKLAESDQ